jgi:ABC-type phosphate/phosphonate transport system substrate-binding protein
VKQLMATTCLGKNTVPILRNLSEQLGKAGVVIHFDEDDGWAEREAAFRAGMVDLVWACGLLTAELIDVRSDYTVVGAPVFEESGQAVYRSIIVVRDDATFATASDLLLGRLAVNEYGSWSGYVGFGEWLAGEDGSIDDFHVHVITGSHALSLDALRDRVADVASIDSTVWDDIGPAGRQGLRAFASTRWWPSPPFSVKTELVEELTPALLACNVAGLVAIEPAEIENYRFMLTTRRAIAPAPET